MQSLHTGLFWSNKTILDTIRHALDNKYEQPDRSLYLLNLAGRISLIKNWDEGVARALGNIGYLYFVRGQYFVATQYYRKALPFAERGFKDKSLLGIFYANMSYPYKNGGKLDSMAYWTYKAENEIRDFNPSTREQILSVNGIYTALGGLWIRMNDQRTSLRYFKKALEVVQPLKNECLEKRYASCLTNVGIPYLNMKMFDSAQYFFEKALEYNSNNTSAILSLAETFVFNNEPEKALPLLNRGLALAQNAKDHQRIIEAKLLLGETYNSLEHDKAERLFREGITLAKQYGFKTDAVWQAYQKLSSIYAAKKMYAKAYAIQYEGIKIRDSLLVNADRESTLALELQSLTSKKDIELAQKQLTLVRKESEINEKNIWIGAISIGAALTIALLIALFRANLHKQRLREETINSMMQEREISNLKSIMKGEEAERTRLARELHDGIMVQLSTVMMNLDTLPEPYRRAAIQDYFNSPYYRQIVTQLGNATRELRQTAHNLMPDMLLDGGLAEALFYFCTTLEKNSGLQISFQQHGEFPRLQPEFEIAVYRIVQELLQNVLKHAKATKTIVQLAHPADELLTVTVEDNGTGMTMDNVSGTTGMGLKSIRTRIRALNGNMEILSSAEKGTTVYLEFDISPAMKRNERVVVSDYQ